MSAKKIAICMGRQSDWPTMKEAAAILDSSGCAMRYPYHLCPSHP